MRGLDRLLSLRGLALMASLLSGLALTATPGWALSSGEHLERARGYFDKREFDSSIIELKNALQRDGKNFDARLLLGRAYILRGRGADAEKELQRARELGADEREIKVLMAQAQLLQGKFQEVLGEAVVEQTDPPVHKAELLALRGEAQLGLNELVDAKQSFVAAVDFDPANADAHAGLGQIAAQQRLFDTAQVELQKAESISPVGVNTLRLKGDLALARGEVAAAVIAYQELVEAFPFVPNVLRLGHAYFAAGKNDDAIRQVNIVLRSNPHHPGAHYLRALIAYQIRDFETAKFHIDQSLAIVPLNPLFQRLAGATNFALGNNEQALRYLERYVAREPADDSARRLLGAVQLRLGQAEEARRTLKSFEGAPALNDSQLLALIGTAAAREGDLESARRYFSQLVVADPDNAEAQSQLAAVQIALGEAEQGIEMLESALEKDPKLDSARISLILAYLKERRFERALEAAQALRDRNPTSPQAHTLVGISYGGLGDLAAAEQAFVKALKLQPGYPDAIINLAAIRTSAGRLDEAAALYNQSLEQNPTHLQSLLGLANLERQRNHPDKEIALLEKAAEAHSNSVPAGVALARAYVDRLEPQKALAAAVPLLDQAPDNPTVLQVVGEAQLLVGATDEAINTFRRLVNIAPDYAQSHFGLARALEAANAVNEADVELQKTLLLDPSHHQAKFGRARLLVRKGELDLAKSLLQDLKSAFPQEATILDLEARIALAQDRPAEAVPLLQQALDVRSDSDTAILLAQAQARANGVDQGIVGLKTWLERFPGDIRVRSFFAQSLLSLSRFDEATDEYQQILADAPNNVAALNNFAWLRQHAGKPEEGLPHARRALLLAPENPGVMDTLGIILLSTGDTTEAVAILRRAHTQVPKNSEIQFHLAKALAAAGEVSEARSLLSELMSEDRKFADSAEAETLLRQLQ